MIITQKWSKLAKLWNEAYEESVGYLHNNGLAPRRQELGLITGAVLHIIPALEKVVMMRSSKERALKVLSVEVTSTSQRIVGVRFPVDSDAITKLKNILVDLKNARNSEGAAFYDERFAPVCQKSMEWATTERKTMKSFFAVVPSIKDTNLITINDKKSGDAPSAGTKRTSSVTPPKTSVVPTKKSKTIASFFSKKN